MNKIVIFSLYVLPIAKQIAEDENKQGFRRYSTVLISIFTFVSTHAVCTTTPDGLSRLKSSHLMSTAIPR